MRQIEEIDRKTCIILGCHVIGERAVDMIQVTAIRSCFLYAVIWWPMGFALAITYFVFISRRYAGKVSVKRDTQDFY